MTLNPKPATLNPIYNPLYKLRFRGYVGVGFRRIRGLGSSCSSYWLLKLTAIARRPETPTQKSRVKAYSPP